MKIGPAIPRWEGVVTTKGQVVIPASLRTRYGIEPGTQVRFEDTPDGILVRPVTKEFIRSVMGLLKDVPNLPAKVTRDPDRELR